MRSAALCGMGEDEFWLCTPRYLWARQSAWETNSRAGWEQARFVAFHVIKTVDSKNRVKRLSDLTRFPWETDRRPYVPVGDTEDTRRFDQSADEVLKLLNPEAYERYKNAQNGNNKST